MAFSESAKLTIQMLLDDKASVPIGGLVGKMDQLAQKGGLVGSVLQGVGQQLGRMAFAAVTSAIHEVTSAIGDSIAMAREEQVGIAKLDTSLKANVTAYDGNRDAIERIIAEREKLAFSDGEQRDSLSLLVTRTHDVTKALALQRIAMDLARLKGMDLASASTMIGKAYDGNYTALIKAGIAIDKNATSTEALAAVQKAAAGQADAYSQTTQGIADSMKIAIQDVQEDIGGMLMPLIKDAALFIRDTIIPAVRDFGAALGKLKPVFDVIAKAVGLAFDQLDRFNKETGGLATAIKVLQGGVGIFEQLSTEAAERTKASVDSMVGSVKEGIDQWLADQKTLVDHTIQQSEEWADNWTKAVNKFNHDAGVGMNTTVVTLGQLWVQGWTKFAKDAGSGLNKIGTTIAEQTPAIVNAAQTLIEKTAARALRNSEKWQAIGRGIPSGIGEGMAKASQLVVDGMAVLLDIMKNGLTPAQQAAVVMGREYVKHFKKGLHSGVPGAQQQAKEVGIAAIVSLLNAGGKGKTARQHKAGEYYASLLASGMTSQQIYVALKAAGLSDAAITALTGKPQVAGATAAGNTLGVAAGNGIFSLQAQSAAMLAAANLVRLAMSYVNAHPVHLNVLPPLHPNVTGGGQNTPVGGGNTPFGGGNTQRAGYVPGGVYAPPNVRATVVLGLRGVFDTMAMADRYGTRTVL